MEIQGIVKIIMPKKIINEKFIKREFVLITDINTPYPQHIILETINDRVKLLDNIQVNDVVKVYFTIKGRESHSKTDNKTRYFVNLECWRIDVITKSENTLQTNTDDEKVLFEGIQESNNNSNNKMNDIINKEHSEYLYDDIDYKENDIQLYKDDELPF